MQSIYLTVGGKAPYLKGPGGAVIVESFKKKDPLEHELRNGKPAGLT